MLLASVALVTLQRPIRVKACCLVGYQVQAQRRRVRCSSSTARRATAPGASAPGGLLLVTGGDEGLGQLFIEKLSSDGLEEPVAVSLSSLTSEGEVVELLRRIKEQYPDRSITGVAHFAATLPSSGEALASVSACDRLEMSFQRLILLLAKLVPVMQASGLLCRILTATPASSQSSPASWPGKGFHNLAAGFVEQYTEALAEELSGSQITVLGIRVAEASLAVSSSAEAERQRIARQLAKVWSLPHLEAHGRILPFGLPELLLTENSTRGGSPVGPSIDARWALRAAAAQAADYPPDARPKAYKELAKGMGIPEQNLVWCHGASDVIVRLTSLAVRRASDRSAASSTPVAVVQQPTWPNVEALLRGGGATTIRPVPYPNPWLAAEAPGDRFWTALERQVNDGSPSPSLVYLTHPHFPTGYKDPAFAQRLARLLTGSSAPVLFIVDQTYLGFTGRTADDEKLEALALSNNSVALIRSLSKVEGLAALRLGCAVGTAATVRALAGGLPFEGGLYISELPLAGAVASLQGPGASRHKARVLDFYQQEQAWLTGELEGLGLDVDRTSCPFFVVHAPPDTLGRAIQGGAALQRFAYPMGSPQGGSPGNSGTAVCLVADRDTNLKTIKALQDALSKEEEKKVGFVWDPQALLKPFVGG